jgi:hypothetical protein
MGSWEFARSNLIRNHYDFYKLQAVYLPAIKIIAAIQIRKHCEDHFSTLCMDHFSTILIRFCINIWIYNEFYQV